MHATNSHPISFFGIGLNLKVLLMWICLGFFFQLVKANSEADRSWLLIKEKNGVKVYEKELDDRIAFRGVGIIPGKPEELVGVLHNPNRWKFWIEDLKEGKLLEQKSKFHFIFCQVINAPWPVKDRELVYESLVKRTGESKIVIEMKSVDHPSVKKTGKRVRATLEYATYMIEPIDDKKMLVTFENLSYPNGRMPELLTNWASQTYPLSIFYGLRREMENSNLIRVSLPE
ncbi:MAG: START domain-containing protein [Verrucomicrobiota bacterium]|nr:START domain-containing protein [Verrucomicrobiota bacterium]